MRIRLKSSNNISSSSSNNNNKCRSKSSKSGTTSNRHRRARVRHRMPTSRRGCRVRRSTRETCPSLCNKKILTTTRTTMTRARDTDTGLDTTSWASSRNMTL